MRGRKPLGYRDARLGYGGFWGNTFPAASPLSLACGVVFSSRARQYLLLQYGLRSMLTALTNMDISQINSQSLLRLLALTERKEELLSIVDEIDAAIIDTLRGGSRSRFSKFRPNP